MRRSPSRPKASGPSISWPGRVTTSARAKVALGPDSVVDGRHLSFTRSLSFVPAAASATDRILTVFGRNAPFRTRNGTETLCSAVHTFADVGVSACMADCSAASCAL